ncbi:MFS transporter [Streptomyces sp. HNM0575]|uniref:MFS transporter n=1 Tax=Streptomyces sp. HNM0575 TaxID=2716338 RepID=UPI00145EE4FD|nr:MFS transporter [Streptomyces sp. HNM0575]
MTAARSGRGPAADGRRGATAVLLLACLGVAMAQTIVVSVLPVFAGRFDVSVPSATWLLTAFMLAAGVATPVAGRLGDLFGHRPVMVACLACLCGGSALALVAGESGWFPGLLAARALQGVSAGAFPLAFGLARLSAAPRRLPGVVAALSAMFGVGGALGMVVAGPLVDASGTTGVLFWLTLVIAAAALAGTVALPRRGPADRRTGGLDPAGALLLSATLVALLLVISQGGGWGWGSAATAGVFAVAVVSGTGFVVVELRAGEPTVDLRLLRRPALVAVNLATVVISIGMFAAVTVIPQLLQTPERAGYGLGATAAGTGLLMVPMAAFMVVAAPLAARLSARTSSRTTFQIGAALAAVALAGLGAAHGTAWQLCLGGALLGAAYGFAFASLGSLVIDAVRTDQTGAATGINTVLRTVGGAIGSQLAAAVVAGWGRPGMQLPAESGYTAAFFIAAAIVSTALLISLAIPTTSGETGRCRRAGV